jgi:ketosteroid isomerase-like protein
MAFKRWFLLATVLLLSACAGQARNNATGDMAALRAIHDAWIASYTSGEVGALQKFYDSDSVIMPDARPTYLGWSSIRDFFAPGFAAFKYEANAQIGRINVSGNLGIVEGVVRIRLVPKTVGEPRNMALRYIVVFRRGDDGVWRILSDMDNRAPNLS